MDLMNDCRMEKNLKGLPNPFPWEVLPTDEILGFTLTQSSSVKRAISFGMAQFRYPLSICAAPC